MAQRRLTRRLLVVAVALLLGACAGSTRLGEAFRPDVYTVRAGDTLYSIAWRYERDVRDLVRWNNIDSPDTIFPGQQLRLRPPPGEPAAAPPVTIAEKPATSQSREAPATVTTAPVEPDPAPRRTPMAPADAPGDWSWPTDGNVIGTFNDGKVSGRGIDIAGRVGQAVRATAAGEVVYSGEGLRAYGPLVIIRHSGEYLSAYAHNERLMVSEGDRVEAGQQIAAMGRAPGDQVLLHFEIRRDGKPVDPLNYLPPRD